MPEPLRDVSFSPAPIHPFPPLGMLNYNGEPHGIRQRKNQKDFAVRMMQFFDHFLKGAPAPEWMTAGIPAIEKGKTMRYELQR